MTDAYELGFALAKTAQLPMSMGVLGNAPRLQTGSQAVPQAMPPGAMPNAPLLTGAAQPPIPTQAMGANQAAPAGGGTPMQQLTQNRPTGLVPKLAADYQVPEQVGSFGSAVYSPESQGQRSADDEPKRKPKKIRARSPSYIY